MALATSGQSALPLWVPAGRLRPRLKGLSRCLARRGAIGRGPRPRSPRSAEPNLGSCGGRGGHSSPGCPPAAVPGPRRAGRGKERTSWGNPHQHQRSGSRVGACKRRGAYRAPRRSGAASLPRNSGPGSQAGRKREEVGQQGVLGREWGETIHSRHPHPLLGREEVQVVIKKARPNHKHPSSSPKEIPM